MEDVQLIFALLRKVKKQEILVVLNFGDMDAKNYKIKLPQNRHIVLLLDSNDELWGGTKVNTSDVTIKNGTLEINTGHFSAQYFLLE